MTLHHIFKDIPYHRFLAVDNLLGTLDSLHNATLDELADHKRLVKLGRHVFGYTALVHLELGTNDDYRTSGIVDTLTEKILAETALLAFERVGERLERTVCLGLDSRRLSRVVEK